MSYPYYLPFASTVKIFRGEQNILRSLSPDFFIQLRIFQHRFHVHIFSALFHTENLSGAAQFKVFLCNLEAVRCRCHRLKAFVSLS